MSDCDCDEIPTQNPIPGPKGAAGAAGAASTVPGPAGENAFTLLTSPFTQPAVSATVDVSVVSTLWMADGQALFIEVGGYYTVDSILSPTSVRLTRSTITGFAATAAVIADDSKVSPAGYAFVDNTQYVALDGRVTALEAAVPTAGIRTYYSATAPTGTITTGSLWFDTDDGFKMYRWDGSGWVAVTATVEVPDFGTGLKPVSVLGALPVGDPDDLRLILLTTDWKLYRWTGTVWTTAVATGDLFGTLPSGAFAANTIAAGVLQAGVILASNIGTNLIITSAANIGAAVINDAHIANLAVSKLTAGLITGQELQLDGAGGILRSSNFSAGSAGFKIDGAGNAEFNAITVRGTLEASKIRTDSAVYNAGSPSNTMPSITWQNAQTGAPASSLGAGGTDFWLVTFYGWGHGASSFDNRYGKATMFFDCIENGGCTPDTGSYVDLEIIYRVNGGGASQVTPYAVRAIDGNGSLNISGGVSISGLGSGDVVEFGVRAKSPAAASSLNVANLTVKAFNF